MATDHAGRVRARLNHLVELDGRTRVKIAEGAGISPAYLYQILSGRKLDPGVSMVGAILESLGKSWPDLDDSKPRKDS